jgi:hypothetical protein
MRSHVRHRASGEWTCVPAGRLLAHSLTSQPHRDMYTVFALARSCRGSNVVITSTCKLQQGHLNMTPLQKRSAPNH